MQYIYWKLHQRNFRRIPTKFDKREQKPSTPKNPPKPSKNFSLYNYPGLR